jgi:hypothetical protein
LPEPADTRVKTVLFGNVNGDGVVDSTDLGLL